MKDEGDAELTFIFLEQITFPKKALNIEIIIVLCREAVCAAT